MHNTDSDKWAAESDSICGIMDIEDTRKFPRREVISTVTTLEYGVTEYRNVTFAIPLELERRIRGGKRRINFSEELRRLLDQALATQGR